MSRSLDSCIEKAARSGRKSVLLGVLSRFGPNAHTTERTLLGSLLAHNHLALADWLMARGARIVRGPRTLGTLLARGQREPARWLLDHGCDPWASWGKEPRDCAMASAYGHGRDTVQWVVEQGVPVDPPDGAGVFGLLELTFYEQVYLRSPLLERLRWVLDLGADPNRRVVSTGEAAPTVFQSVIRAARFAAEKDRGDVGALLELFLAHAGNPEAVATSPSSVWNLLLQQFPDRRAEWVGRREAWRLGQALPSAPASARRRL